MQWLQLVRLEGNLLRLHDQFLALPGRRLSHPTTPPLIVHVRVQLVSIGFVRCKLDVRWVSFWRGNKGVFRLTAFLVQNTELLRVRPKTKCLFLNPVKMKNSYALTMLLSIYGWLYRSSTTSLPSLNNIYEILYTPLFTKTWGRHYWPHSCPLRWCFKIH